MARLLSRGPARVSVAPPALTPRRTASSHKCVSRPRDTRASAAQTAQTAWRETTSTRQGTETLRENPTITYRPRVCILGGGFGGLYTAVRLESLLWPSGTKPEIILVDQNDRFVFKPLLYELLTAEAQPWEVAPEFLGLLAPYNIRFVKATVDRVEPSTSSSGPAGGVVQLKDGTSVAYDWLVLALGTESNTAAVDGATEHTLSFYTYDDAVRVRDALQRLQHTPHTARVTVVGGGYAGVELATTVAKQMAGQAWVSLIVASDTVMSGQPQPMIDAATAALAQHGVQVTYRNKVMRIRGADDSDKKIVSVQDIVDGSSQELESDLVLWTAGTSTAGHASEETFPFPRNARGCVETDATLRVLRNDRVFAVGDLVAMMSEDTMTWQPPLPASAQVAFQQADYAAWNIWSAINGRTLLPFRYQHLGSMMSLGRLDGSVTLSLPVPSVLQQSIESTPLAGVLKAAGLSLESGAGLAVRGPLAAVLRRAAYWYRQPTNEHRLRVGASWFRQALQDIQDGAQSVLAQRS